jgi:glycosyltransferase involved in cell wall biosynthesis
MISIIICSRSKQMLAQVEKSIAYSIGVTFELIEIDNSLKKYGICEAYNVGASKAKYDVLCFMHEDVLFHSNDWGSVVVNLLHDKRAGVLGLAGGSFQAKAPIGWGGANQLFGVNIMHTVNGQTSRDYVNPFGKESMQAATLDGVWLCCRKEVWNEFKFDSVSFPGFHFYDIDFCARVCAKYKNYVLFNIEIEHFSKGNYDYVWMQNALSFYKKRKHILPIATLGNSQTEKSFFNLMAFQSFVVRAIENKLPKKDIAYCLLQCFKINFINRDNIYLLKIFITSLSN